MRTSLLIAAATFMIVVAASFAAGRQDVSQPAVGSVDELKIGTGWDATKPGDFTAYGMWEPAVLIYESLIALDEDSKPIPCLADSWSVSDDGLTWNFRLHEGIAFHDGTAFTAEAVVANYEQLRSASWMKLAPYISRATAVDRLSVRFVMTRPHPLLLQELASGRYGMISPAVLAEKKKEAPDGMGSRSKSSSPMGSGAKGGGSAMPPAMAAAMGGGGASYVVTHPVGTGPYTWDAHAYERNRSFSVVANAGYWRGEPRIKRITWEVIPDPGARTMALESGGIQMTGQSPNAAITGENLVALRRNDELRVTMASNWGARLLIINHTRPPFDQLAARKALRHALNYEEIQVIVGELAVICPGPFGPDTPFVLPDAELPAFDPGRAGRMFDELGITDGDGDGFREYGGQKISLEIISTKHPTLSVLLQEQLKEVGIELRIAAEEQGSQFAILEQMAFDIASHANIPSFSLDLYNQFSDSGDWSLQLHDPELEEMLAEYRLCTTHDRFVELSHEIQRRVLAKHVILFAINERKVAVYRRGLGEFVFPPEEWVGSLQEIWRM